MSIAGFLGLRTTDFVLTIQGMQGMQGMKNDIGDRRNRFWSIGAALGLGTVLSICDIAVCHAIPPGLETLPGQSPSQSNEQNARAAARDQAAPSGSVAAPTETGGKPIQPVQSSVQPPETLSEPKSEEASLTREGSNPIFAFTHLLPSPLTIPAGRLVIGSEVAYGLFGWAQIGTGIVEDIFQVFNVDARVRLIDFPRFALGAGATFETYNLQNYGSANPDLRVNSWLPGITAAYEVAPRMAVFVGGNLNITHEQIPSVLQTSGYVQGAQLETDFSYAYNPPRRPGSIGNVIAGGVTYDMTYRITGVGISHYWPGFRLGFHYFLNASQNRLLPIIAGGTLVEF